MSQPEEMDSLAQAFADLQEEVATEKVSSLNVDL